MSLDDFWPFTLKKKNEDKSKGDESCKSHNVAVKPSRNGVICDELKDDERCDEYMLQYLHRWKRFIRRALNYAWCYTQYCYPGLRTVEYYKKVKRICQEREKVKKKEKNDEKNKKTTGKKKIDNEQPRQAVPLYLSTAVGDVKLLADSSTQTLDEGVLSVLDESYENEPSPYINKHLKHLARPLGFLPAIEEELGWGQRILNHIKNVSRTIVHSLNNSDQNHQIRTVLKVVCVLLAPTAIWLGANYVFLKKKYISLSGKLKRVKEENDILKKKCCKLGSVLSTTENLEIPFSTEESRQQVVAEFTRLEESRKKSKNEITRLSTEKAALLEELKMARKQRDLARSHYSSIPLQSSGIS